MPSETDPLLAHISLVATRYGCVHKCILFGSRANGTAKRESDYDIAVEWSPATADGWGSFADEVIENKPVLNAVDLLRIHLAGQPLRDQIQKEGVVFYDKNRT